MTREKNTCKFLTGQHWVLPAIAAIILHGLLLSLKLPEQLNLKPVPHGIPITIESRSVSRQAALSEKKVDAREKIVPDEHEKKIVLEKVIKSLRAAVVPPPEKALIEPEQIKKEAFIESSFDPQKPESESRPQDRDEPPAPEKNSAAETAEQQTIDQGQSEKRADNPRDMLSEEDAAEAPIVKIAVPMYRLNMQPAYPALARRRGLEGKVLLNVLVDGEGRVAELHVKNSSGHSSLDRAAVRAVKGWLFTPGLAGGQSVPMWVDVPIIFQLK